MENEIWKPVVGYEGLYEVSNLGNVRSVRWRGGYMTHDIYRRVNGNGYYDVVLVRDKTIKYATIHRLVAQAFIPNTEGKRCVDHIDGNRLNNRVENLRWCTHKENANNPISRKRQSIAQRDEMKKKWEKGRCDRLKKPVLQYTLEGEFVARWDSAADAARAHLMEGKRLYSVEGKITQCCRCEARRTLGYLWIYEGDEDVLSGLIDKNKRPRSIRVKMKFQDGHVEEFDSINKAARATGMQNSTIREKRFHEKLNISWELLDECSCYENRWGGKRSNYPRKNKLKKL